MFLAGMSAAGQLETVVVLRAKSTLEVGIDIERHVHVYASPAIHRTRTASSATARHGGISHPVFPQRS